MARRPVSKAGAPTTARKTAPARAAAGIGGAAWPLDRRRAADLERHLRPALVAVPVNVYPATASGARVSFHQVHKPSGKRIRYQKIVPGIGPVETDETVSAYELESGRYVLLEPESIDRLKLDAKRMLDLAQFVDADEVDPIWLDNPCYLAPDGELAEEACGVSRGAMRRTEKYGLGQLVMRGREYIACLKPCGSGMMPETLRLADEVRESAPCFADVEEVTPDKEMLELAEELIERKTAPFDPEKFHDRHTEAVRELIEAKRKRQRPVAVEEEETSSRGAEVIDLVDALKRSMRGAARDSGGQRAEPRRKKA